MATQNIDPALKKTMTSSLRLYDEADAKWFNVLADDATVFAIGRAEPFIGKKAYEKNFLPALAATKRKTKVLHQDIRMLDTTAVVTQTLQIKQDGILSSVRQSVIWTKAKKDWQIRHLHTALVGQPSASSIAKSAGDIQILNEKIATVAAVLGVAQ